MRKPWIGGNWKMHKTVDEARSTATALAKILAESGSGAGGSVDVALFPPFPLLSTVGDALQSAGATSILLGGQTLSEHESGAYTGEVSGTMLSSLGCRLVLVGHSERRHVFGESDTAVNAKLRQACRCGLDPVLCVGETLEERESGQTESVIQRQIEAGFEGVELAQAKRVTVAYEPVWAIGTGKVATTEQAVEVHAAIRSRLASRFGKDYGQALRIHYGGSVKPDNVEALIGEEEIDGALVGGASLDADSFATLVSKAGVASRAGFES